MNSLKFQDRLLGLQDNLLNFAYMLTANREEAKDLLQDTTLKALDNEDKCQFQRLGVYHHAKYFYQ